MAVTSNRTPPSIGRIEILIGRSLAYCAHPVAAWHRSSTARRWFLVTSYFVGGYVSVFSALELLR